MVEVIRVLVHMVAVIRVLVPMVVAIKVPVPLVADVGVAENIKIPRRHQTQHNNIHPRPVLSKNVHARSQKVEDINRALVPEGEGILPDLTQKKEVTSHVLGLRVGVVADRVEEIGLQIVIKIALPLLTKMQQMTILLQ